MWIRRMPRPGAKLRRGEVSYKFERLAGEGLTSELWKAHRITCHSKVEVAIKILKSGTSDEILRREFSILRRLPSTFSLKAHEVQTFFGRRALVMEWVEGLSLHELVKLELDSPCKRLIAKDLAKALLELDEANLYHGDISPRNIMVDMAGRVRLIDFGHFESSEELVGTAEFLAPERWENSPADWAADLYSLGAVFKWLQLDVDPALHSPRPFERLAIKGRLCSLYIIDGELDEIRARLSSIVRQSKMTTPARTQTLIAGSSQTRTISFRFALLLALATLVPVSAHVLQVEGRISIRGECWVQVVADGRDYGYAPLSISLPPGKHEFIFKTSDQENKMFFDIRPTEEVLILASRGRKGCVTERKMKPSL